MGEIESEGGYLSLTIGQGGGNGEGLTINTFKSYSFNSHFLTPTDGWSFTLGTEDISDTLRIAIAPRQLVTFKIRGKVQCTGYVDKVVTHSSRNGGTDITIEGRDILSPACDSVLDPKAQTSQFKETMTLADLMPVIFGPFGWSDVSAFELDDIANQNVMTGKVHGEKTSKKGKPLKSYQLHRLRPYPHETAFAFAARVCKNFGLWIWPSADGTKLVVSQPEFDVDSGDKFLNARHKKGNLGGLNNIISAQCTRDATAQPAVIFGSAFGSGGANPRDQFTKGVVNPAIQCSQLATILDQYPHTDMIDLAYLGNGFSGTGRTNTKAKSNEKIQGLKGLVNLGGNEDEAAFEAALAIHLEKTKNEASDGIKRPDGFAVVDTYARPLFLHDDNSKKPEELESFLKRELAKRMHQSFLYHFEVEGHEYVSVDGQRYPWAVNSFVNVDDDFCDVHASLWILSRTFTKSRSGGTRTTIECILPHTLEF